MALDLGKFHATFFEESFENVETLESALLSLDPQAVDAEVINTVFRAAHSIKGGAGTFGFAEVANFTHLLETLLDDMRSGCRTVSAADTEVLLTSTDALRELLEAARGGNAANAVLVADRRQALEAALRQRPAMDVAPDAAVAQEAAVPFVPHRWQIRFAPRPGLFHSGNDPLRILRALSRLGTLNVEAELPEALTLAGADPEEARLCWRLTLESAADLEEIREVFAWVEDEAEIEIHPLAESLAENPAPDGRAGSGSSDAVTPDTASQKPALTLIEGGLSAKAAAVPPPSSSAGTSRRSGPESSASIRVSTEKIDSLINLVGELVITQSMLAEQAGALDPVQCEKLLAGLEQLSRNTRQMQESVMSIRMLPMDFVFSRFPRLVHDLAVKLGKDVRLETHGSDTELDKSVIEKISDPLTHLVRNALDHGIESQEQRLAAGKPAQGCITLAAAHRGGNIVIEIRDDGHGLDRERILAKAHERGLPAHEGMGDAEVWQLIFAPGFSTADVVTDVSGRGVGMDVVKKNILALGGTVDLHSQAGLGTTISIRLPLTLAILDGMSIRVGSDTFIVPINCVTESLQPAPEQIHSVAGSGRVVRVRGEYLPLLPLGALFGIAAEHEDPTRGVMVLIEAEGRRVALQVDELLAQQQVVIKSLEANYRRVAGISGATILGDGQVALILDTAALVRGLHQRAAA